MANDVRGARSADLLSRIVGEIDARCDELRPLVAEYERLLGAAEALERDNGSAARKLRTAPTAPTAPPAAAAAPALVPAAAKTARAPAARKVTGARRESPASTMGRAGSTASKRGQSASAGTRAVRGAAQTAILAALEHGSHTVAELAVVTAMSGPSIRVSLRRLLGTGAVTRAKRDGKAAYALARSVRS
jgi:hypothetical protein